VESGQNPTASVIWLHGLGADGHDFEPVVPQLGLPESLSLRFVFPHAPVRPVTLNNGMAMRAWYDIISLDAEGRSDEQGIRESQSQIEKLIHLETEKGIATQDIVLAGFSQGGAIALQTGLRFPEKLAGIMALSTYLPLPKSLKDELSIANSKTPVFMAHGQHDPVVPFDFGVQSREQLLEHGVEAEWHDYPMAHQVCMEQLTDIGQWLTKVLT